MDLGIESSPRCSNGLCGPVFGSIGVLMNFAVRAVHKGNFFVGAEQQPVMEPVKESVFGEPVKVLEDGEPVPEFCRESTPCAAIAGQIPEGVEVFIKGGAPASRMRTVSVRKAPFITLIFLAAHGAVPA